MAKQAPHLRRKQQAKEQQRKAKKLRKQKRAGNASGIPNKWWQDREILLHLGLALLLTTLTLVSFLGNDFTNWDDELYVLEQPLTKNGDVVEIFTSEVGGNYHPLTMLSLAVNHMMAGEEPFVYLLTNLLLHLINVILVYFFILKLTEGKRMVALITAVLFGIHPMHVESVAWVSERKDMLYTLFFVSGMMAYLEYLKKPSTKQYLLITGVFILSLLSKPAAVVFPVTLLLLDYYKERDWSMKWVIEKAPWFVLSFILGVFTVVFQDEAIGEIERYNIAERISFASYGFITYIGKLFVPAQLSCFHPYPKGEALPAIFYAAPILALAIAGGAVYSMRKTRLFAFALAFYLVNVALVLQFVTVGSTIISERYTYVPYIGLFFLLGMGYDWLANQPDKQGAAKGVLIGLAAFTLVCAALSFQRTKVWANSEVLWTDVLEKYPTVAQAFYNRGKYYETVGKEDNALEDYTNAIKYNSKKYKAITNRANILGRRGKLEEALAEYDKAIAIDPDQVYAYINRGNMYVRLKRSQEAMPDLNKALELDPNNYEAYFNLASAYRDLGQYDQALVNYSKTIEIRPNDDGAYNNRGNVHYRMQNFPAALQDYNRALQLNANNGRAYGNRAAVYFQQKQFQLALNDYSQAILREPNNGRTYLNRSFCYSQLGQKQQALADAQKAQQLGAGVDPNYLRGLGGN